MRAKTNSLVEVLQLSVIRWSSLVFDWNENDHTLSHLVCAFKDIWSLLTAANEHSRPLSAYENANLEINTF